MEVKRETQAEGGQEIEIDLLALIRALWHNAWAVALTMLAGGVVLFLYAYLFITPLYQAEAVFYVNNSTVSVGNIAASISTGDISAAKSLVGTYSVILKTRTTLNEVIEEANLPYDYEQLQKMISAGAVNGTEIFSVTVTSRSPAESELIANTIAKVLPDKIADIVDGSSVRIVDYAVRPNYRVSPSLRRYAMIGAIIGFLLSAAVIFLREYFDDKIYSEDYFAQNYPKIPLLAVIPDMSEERSGSGYYGYEKKPKEQKGKHH